MAPRATVSNKVPLPNATVNGTFTDGSIGMNTQPGHRARVTTLTANVDVNGPNHKYFLGSGTLLRCKHLENGCCGCHNVWLLLCVGLALVTIRITTAGLPVNVGLI